MKKIIFTILVSFLCIFTVNASTGKTNNSKISIQSVKVTVKETAGHNEKLTVSYDINPNDTTDAKLTWSVTGLKKGVTAKFTNGNVTNNVKGTFEIELSNTLLQEVEIKLIAKNGSKKLSENAIKIETKEETEKREAELIERVETLLNNLDEKVNKKNYDETYEALEEINDIFDNNSSIKDKISETLLSKYETLSESIDNYDNGSNAGTIIISVLLVVAFVAGMFIIFKKEEK